LDNRQGSRLFCCWNSFCFYECGEQYSLRVLDTKDWYLIGTQMKFFRFKSDNPFQKWIIMFGSSPLSLPSSFAFVSCIRILHSDCHHKQHQRYLPYDTVSPYINQCISIERQDRSTTTYIQQAINQHLHRSETNHQTIIEAARISYNFYITYCANKIHWN
jgi:hypothetical protein